MTTFDNKNVAEMLLAICRRPNVEIGRDNGFLLVRVENELIHLEARNDGHIVKEPGQKIEWLHLFFRLAHFEILPTHVKYADLIDLLSHVQENRASLMSISQLGQDQAEATLAYLSGLKTQEVAFADRDAKNLDSKKKVAEHFYAICQRDDAVIHRSSDPFRSFQVSADNEFFSAYGQNSDKVAQNLKDGVSALWINFRSASIVASRSQAKFTELVELLYQANVNEEAVVAMEHDAAQLALARLTELARS